MGGGAKHLIIARQYLQNKVDTFVTLQNGRNEFYTPLYIFNEQKFIELFESFGYEVVDSWYNPFDGASLPFHRDIRIYVKGFYFRKTST